MATVDSTAARPRLNIGKEISSLKRMTVRELRAKYAEIFGEPTNSHHKEWLFKRIVWRMQANEQGDLSERARRRAAELANDADIRTRTPRAPRPAAAESIEAPSATIEFTVADEPRLPPAGSLISRVYKQNKIEVLVLKDGFEFEGDFYKSLSAVAKKITGSHCNGFRFFGLCKNGCDQ